MDKGYDQKRPRVLETNRYKGMPCYIPNGNIPEKQNDANVYTWALQKKRRLKQRWFLITREDMEKI